jgi:membrane protein YdbS with pleckstrin-like domain
MSPTEEPRDAPTDDGGAPPALGPAAPPAWAELGRELPLAPAWIRAEQLSGLVWAAIFAAVAGLILGGAVIVFARFSLAAAAALFAAGVALLLALALGWPRLAYRHYSYRLEENGVHLRRGVLWRSQIAVPRSRIQHTDVSQGPFERLYGLATLTLHTAGNHYASISLPGLEHGAALAARDFLLAARAAGEGDAV